MSKILKSGPIKYSEPSKPLEAPRMIEYEKLETPTYSNTANLDIDEGEQRFPQDAKVPNKKKYSENGNYVKNRLPKKKKDDPSRTVESMGAAMRGMALSNKFKKNG